MIVCYQRDYPQQIKQGGFTMKGRLVAVVGLTLMLAMGLATVASAEDYNKFGVRFRAAYVMPNETVDSRLDPLDLKVSDDVIPGIDLEYFFMKNVSAELFAAVTRNDIRSQGQLVGSTWLLPPTLTAKYHPLAGSAISPYVGFGINVTLPFKSNLTAVSDFSIDNSVGWVAQAGADFKIKDNIYFNVDYKYVNVDTKMTIVGTKFKLDLNPNLFGMGIGYRF
jgi:outer membrane protein